MKLGVLFSSGKDSCLAMHIAKEQGHQIVCLISLESENPYSWMFHTPNVQLVKEQAKCLDLPLVMRKTKGEKEKELIDLKGAISEAREKYPIDGVITGAVYSRYQWTRVDKICGDLNLVCQSPLWHHDQEQLLRDLISNKFNVIISSIACDGLTKDFLGKKIDTDMIQKLSSLNKEIGINVAGEGGEYETLVVDCPMFKKKIVIEDSQIVMENENTGNFIVKKIRLEEKE
ncbi:diphthine--ammonia ligase [Candidatus Woesearchaeota archaeon]|nr:diphthine--ammonia ligase [Candidatus Woesearchaeota archaeon]